MMDVNNDGFFENEPVCKDCNGTGSADSGGTYSWGEPIFIRCHCTYPTTPQRTWVGLDVEDYIKALELCDFDKDAAFDFFEAKLKELNT